jgi:hypothetical protein
MAFTLNIETDNDAFGTEGYERNDEISRILHDVAGKVADGWNTGKARDAGGFVVGEWNTKAEPPVTYVVVNAHRAIIYAGTDKGAATSAIGRDPGNYAEAWRDGEAFAAWNRDIRSWVSTDSSNHLITL